MKKSTINYSIKGLIFGLLMILSTLAGGRFVIVGYVASIALYIFIFINSKKINFKSKINRTILLYLVYLLTRFIIQVIGGTIYDTTIRSLFFQTFIFIFIIFYNSFQFEQKHMEQALNIYAIYVLFMGLILAYLGKLEDSIFFSTQFGSHLFCLFSVLMLSESKKNKMNKLIKLLLIIITMGLSFLSGMRSVFVSEVLVFIMIKFFGSAKNKFNNLLFWIVIATCIAIPHIYMLLYTNVTPQIAKISAFLVTTTRKLTHANFFSGRNIIWAYVIEAVNSKPFFGYGVGAAPGSLFGINLSTHNLFLYICLEIGYIGLVIFICFLYRIWNYYIKNVTIGKYKNIKYFMLGIMIQQTFSLGLLAGKISVAIISWIIICVGVNKEHKEGGQENVKNK